MTAPELPSLDAPTITWGGLLRHAAVENVQGFALFFKPDDAKRAEKAARNYAGIGKTIIEVCETITADAARGIPLENIDQGVYLLFIEPGDTLEHKDSYVPLSTQDARYLLEYAPQHILSVEVSLYDS